MKMNIKQKTAMAMSIMMLASLTGCGAETAEITTEEETLASNSEEITDVLSDSLGIGSETDADKEETVYVIADANGNAQDTIVSEWLKNTEKKDTIEDVSKLSDIENVSGDETFEQDGTKLKWQAGGNDIYYQGHSSEASPVSVKVSYQLDGKDVSADELLGKSGHIKIRYDYTNTAKSGDVYTPFVMATGLTLDLEKFKNVEVENGKLISDGSRYIVVGYGMPGLSDSLDLDIDDLNLPDYFEMEADVTDFSLGMSVTVATIETLGSDEDIDISDVEDEIDDLAGEYQTGMNSLVSGISEYTNGVDQVASGVNTLSSGSETLYSGAGSLKSGIETAADGADSAYSGAQAVSEGCAQLNEAVQQISLPDVSSMSSGSVDDATKAAIKSKAEESIGDTASYIGTAVSNAVTGAVTADTVSQVIAYKQSGDSAVATAAQTAAAGQAETAKAAATSAADAASYKGSASAKALEGAKASIEASLKAAYMAGGDDEETAISKAAAQAETLVNSIYKAGYGDGYGTAYCTGYGAGYASEYGTYLSEFNKYTALLSDNFQSEEFQGTITNVANAYAGAGSAVTLNKVGETMGSFSEKLDTLKSSTQQLADGSASLTNGMEALTDGMDQLESGSATLYSGTATLKNGVSTMKSGTDTLTANSSALNDGAGELSDATDLLIDKLNDTEDGVNDFIDSVNEVKSAARDYKSFGGVSGDMTAKTKFIIKVEGIEANTK